MHRAGIMLLFAAAGMAVGQTGGDTTPTRMSERLAQEIRATLPDFDPTVKRAERLADTPLEPGVIRMPEMVVQDRNLAVRAMEEQERDKAEFLRLKRNYLASMNGVTALLNSWAIPYLSLSVDAQSSADAHRKMMKARAEGFETVAKAVATTDPEAGVAMQRTINAWSKGTRPAGWPPIRL